MLKHYKSNATGKVSATVLEMLFGIKHTCGILLHHLSRCIFPLFIGLMWCEGNQAAQYSQHILGVIVGISWHKVGKHRGKDLSSATAVGGTVLLGAEGAPRQSPGRQRWLAGHGLTVTSALRGADEKGGWQQQGDGRVEGERDVLSLLSLPCFPPESISCARTGCACPWGCGSSA